MARAYVLTKRGRFRRDLLPYCHNIAVFRAKLCISQRERHKKWVCICDLDPWTSTATSHVEAVSLLFLRGSTQLGAALLWDYNYEACGISPTML